jgi:hypothetical protein
MNGEGPPGASGGSSGSGVGGRFIGTGGTGGVASGGKAGASSRGSGASEVDGGIDAERAGGGDGGVGGAADGGAMIDAGVDARRGPGGNSGTDASDSGAASYCQPGASACTTWLSYAIEAIATCREDGRGYAVDHSTDCPSDTACVATSAGAHCVPLVCSEAPCCLAGQRLECAGDGLSMALNGPCVHSEPDCRTVSVGASCTDGTQDAEESDIDCGGSACPSCAVGSRCAVDGDCASHFCSGGVCAVADWTDGKRNGLETGVDCGSIRYGFSRAPSCSNGQECVHGSDCVDGLCAAGTCRPGSCYDGVKNGTETDIDCGASCAPCIDGRRCANDVDCQSLHCALDGPYYNALYPGFPPSFLNTCHSACPNTPAICADPCPVANTIPNMLVQPPPSWPVQLVPCCRADALCGCGVPSTDGGQVSCAY